MSIAPIEPIGDPALGGPPPARRTSLGNELLFALIAAAAVAALGAPVGLLWSVVAPKVELVQTDFGPYPVEGEPEGYWADDGWFIIIALVMGAVVAVVAWLVFRRQRGPIMLGGLVIGSAAASVLAAWLGNKIGYAHYLDLVEHAPKDTRILRPVKLRTGESGLLLGFIPWARGTMLIQALAAAAVYTGLAGFHASPTLRYETMPPEYLDPAPDAAAQPHPQGFTGPSGPVFGPPPSGSGFGPPPSGPAFGPSASGSAFGLPSAPPDPIFGPPPPTRDPEQR
ncbi:DUF2567 domain-containing protein [Dactylosporangium fulvum]|uniref:DUF2567 domain-containing protein n=1 Tax=Dactylosporangium fulvum TaxID=53359 RepID=A0ABY5VTH8_9ACTN|nr:DUF2567 domain-containing protein [Dactylosporangium fulvum]UWP81033.1 DUF2567 domain-containing protein [Dactylosporangium fulvum]